MKNADRIAKSNTFESRAVDSPSAGRSSSLSGRGAVTTFVIEGLYYVLTTKERFEIFSFGFVGLFLAFAGIVLYRSDAFVLAWSSLFLTFLCFVFFVKFSFKTKNSLLISM